jgi:hypothetical protein
VKSNTKAPNATALTFCPFIGFLPEARLSKVTSRINAGLFVICHDADASV